jgi:hypothetical protein
MTTGSPSACAARTMLMASAISQKHPAVELR